MLTGTDSPYCPQPYGEGTTLTFLQRRKQAWSIHLPELVGYCGVGQNSHPGQPPPYLLEARPGRDEVNHHPSSHARLPAYPTRDKRKP